MIRDLPAAALVTLAFLALIAAAEAWRRLARPPVEWTRKLVHLGGGAVCLTLPFVIQSHWVVLGMAAGMALLFLVSRRLGWLESLHGIGRASRGSEYYPLVVYLIFVLAAGQPWKYVICILVLAVSDTLAALIGGRYGVIRYEVEDEHKSLEGSLVFLAATFLAVQLPLFLWQGTAEIPAPLNCLSAALLVAVLVTLFEAVSLRGSDNLWIPLGTYVALTKILRQPLEEIVVQISSLLVIFAAVGFAAWRSGAFNVGGALVCVLAAYASWSLGSFDWALPVFIGLALYLLAFRLATDSGVAKVRALLQWLLPPFLALAVANALWRENDAQWYRYLYGPYLAGCVTVVILRAWNLMLWNWPLRGGRRAAALLAVTSGGLAAMALPAWLAQDVPFSVLLPTAAGCLLAAIIHDRFVGRRPPEEEGTTWVAMRFIVTVAAMGVVAALQSAGAAELWRPE